MGFTFQQQLHLCLQIDCIMIVSLIAAAAENNVIGKDNKLVWHLPDDFKFFKNKTLGHHIIMGRKTFESTGVLKNRKSVIISRNKDYTIPEGCLVVPSIAAAIASVQNDEEAFIIGGADIYKQSLQFADKIYLTRVHTSMEGDAYFPEIDEKNWELVAKEDHAADEKHLYAFSFLEYRKK